MKKLTKSILLLTASFVLASCGGLTPSTTQPSSSEESSPTSSASQASSGSEVSSTSSESQSEASSEQSGEITPSESTAPISSSEAEEVSSQEISSVVTSEASIEESSSAEESSESSSEESSSIEESSQSSEESYISPLGPGETYLSWTKVTEDDLNDGDVILFGSQEKGILSNGFGLDKNVGYLSATSATFKDDKAEIKGEFLPIVLRKELDGSYKFSTELGYLGAFSANKLSFEEGAEKAWNISFSNGTANVKSADASYGSLYYNSTSQRFTTYTKKSSTYRNVEIYRAIIGTPIYPQSITLSGPSSLQLGTASQLSWEYLPSSANILGVSFSSSNEEVLTVSDKGEIKALSLGKATVEIKGYSSEETMATMGSIEIEVLPVPVTGITLSDTSKQLAIGQTLTLTPTVAPSNATDQSVTWESSSDTVASVDNDGVVTANAEGTATITATTVDGSFEASCEISVISEPIDSWTILMYVCGSNLESEEDDFGRISGLATEDLEEILGVKGQPEDVNIIVETGGASKWSSRLGISSKKIERYSIKNGKFTKLASLSNASMGAQSTFQSFLTWGLENYPASKTGVILWDHGGAMSGCCQDENYNDILTPKEAYNAISAATKANNITSKLEFIGYDCCLMQVADIAEMNSDYFKYMVTSQETEVGNGWAYEGWIDDLYRGEETTVILQEICDTFIDSVQDLLDYYSQIDHTEYDNDQTLSYLDLSKMGAYKEAIEAYASEMGSVIRNNKNEFKNLVKKAKSYADTWLEYNDYYYYIYYYGYSSSDFEKVTEDGTTYYVLRGYLDYGTFDAVDFFNVLSTSTKFNSDYIPQAIAAVEEAVCYNRIGDEAGNSNGLTLIANIGGAVSSDYKTTCGSRFTNWLNIFSNLF